MFASTVFQLVLAAVIVTIIALVGLRWVAAARVQTRSEEKDAAPATKRHREY